MTEKPHPKKVLEPRGLKRYPRDCLERITRLAAVSSPPASPFRDVVASTSAGRPGCRRLRPAVPGPAREDEEALRGRHQRGPLRSHVHLQLPGARRRAVASWSWRSWTASSGATTSSTSRRASSSASWTSWPGDGPLTEGLPLGEERGRLFVEVGEARPGPGEPGVRPRQARPPHPGPRRGAAREAEGPAGHPGQQGRQPADEGEVAGPPRRGLHDGQGAPRGPPVLGDRVLGGALGRDDRAAAPRAALRAPRRVPGPGRAAARTSTW